MSYVEWLPPADPFPSDDHVRAVAYCEGQRRFDAAVWAGYRHRVGGRIDHELVLRLVDPPPEASRRRALFWGVSHEVGVRAYIGIPTREQMSGALKVGEILWERTGPAPADADPLDFDLVHSPVDVPAQLVAAIGDVGRAFPVVSQIRLGLVTLLKSREISRQTISVGVECDDSPSGLGKGPVGALSDIVAPFFRDRYAISVAMGSPPDDGPRTPVVYARDLGASR